MHFWPQEDWMAHRTDWTRVRELTGADIAAAVKDDPDSFLPDDAWFDNARVIAPRAGDLVTIRLESAVLEWFRKTGRDDEGGINAVLRAFVNAQKTGRADA